MRCIPSSLESCLALHATSEMMNKMMKGGGVRTNVLIIQHLLLPEPESRPMEMDKFHHVVVVHKIRRSGRTGACGGKDHSSDLTRMAVLHLFSLVIIEIGSNKGPDAVVNKGNPFSL